MSSVPKRGFRIWGLGLLIVFALASIVLFIRLASRPSEPFISVSLVHTNVVWTDTPLIRIEVTNKIALDVDCWLEPTELLWSGKWVPVTSDSSGFFRINYFLKAHSQRRLAWTVFGRPSDPMRFNISYQRRLKPFEVSLLNKLPWLKRHYPFNRQHSSPVYEWRKSETGQ